jgi:putative tryptophan/tyrosine transport system substrate-binding protein
MFGMRRREFITVLGGSMVAWPLAARAQQPGKVYRVGFLANDPTIPTTAAGQAFRDGLHENGFIEGQNVSIEWRFMQGSIERAAAFAAELIRLNVDVIVSSGTQSHPAVKRATAKIPIVMANSQDPVGQGLVASLAHPGGNITGLVQIESAQFGGKRLQLFKDAVPQISRVGVIINPELKTDAAQWDVSERAANSLGITLQAVRARQGSELVGALTTAMQAGPNALFALGNGMNLTYRKVIVDFAAEHRLPSMHSFTEAATEGGLMAYAPSRPDLFRRAATYVAKIFNGAKPADLPIEQPTKFELVINLRTAKALGLTIPQPVLLLADEVIE